MLRKVVNVPDVAESLLRQAASAGAAGEVQMETTDPDQRILVTPSKGTRPAEVGERKACAPVYGREYKCWCGG